MKTLYHASNREFTKLLKSKLRNSRTASFTEDKSFGENIARDRATERGGEPWLYTFIIDETNAEQVRYSSDKTAGLVGWILVADELTPHAREKLK